MSYFPFYVDLEQKKILIAGGGKVAARKIKSLLEYGPSILVIAPKVEEEIFQIKEQLKQQPQGKKALSQEPPLERLFIKQREFQEKDLEEGDIVIAATDSPAKNSFIYELCKQAGKPVNVVDVPEECDFIFPAIVKKKDLTVAVSTGGKSPLFASMVKKELLQMLPDYYGDLVDALGKCRNKVMTEVSEIKKRRKIFESLIEIGKKQGGRLTEQEIQGVIEKEV